MPYRSLADIAPGVFTQLDKPPMGRKHGILLLVYRSLTFDAFSGIL